MFYASSDYPTCLKELRPEVGQTLFLGHWRIDKPSPYRKHRPFLRQGQDETAFGLLSNYIDEQFTKSVPHAQSHEYMLSAAFAACYARGVLDPTNPQITLPMGCIEYRSAVPLAPGYNVAIHPKVAEDVLSLIDVVELRVTEVRDDWIGCFRWPNVATRPIT